MAKYSSYILNLLISILVVILFVNHFGPTESWQQSLNDFLCRVTAPSGRRPNVAIVMIDGPAQDRYGAWPWNYDLVADLTAATASAKPKAIMIDFPLAENAEQDSAGYTEILAGQLSWIDNVVLPYDIAMATYRRNITSNPKQLFYNSVSTSNPLGLLNEDASLQVRKVFLPAEKLLRDKPFLGFVYDAPDDDRVLRREPLLMNYEGFYYPSQTLLTVAVYLGIPPDQIKVNDDRSIDLGAQRRLLVGRQSEFFIRYSRNNPFAIYSAADVLSEGFDFGKLAGKLVIIGVDDVNQTEYFDTPVRPAVSPFWVKASVIENIVNRNTLVEWNKMPLLDMLILFLLGAIFAFLLPRVNMLYRFLILFGSLIVLANINYFMVSSFGMLSQTIYITLEIVLFMAAAPILDSRFLTGEKATTAVPVKARSPRAKKAAAFEEEPPVREIRSSAADEDNVKTTAVSQHDETVDRTTATPGVPTGDHQELKTAAVNQALEEEIEAASDSPSEDYGVIDLSEDERQHPVDESSASNRASATPSGARDSQGLAAFSQTPEITHLGRYQVSDVLGKGAMGLVYKGIDPAINRPVALKTIRLDFVHDPEEMEELKERLFREAQAAGKLSHPNIVTIYDVGSEDQLQYIAMEYLEGQTLEDLIKKKTKFNYRIIAQIITQICNALDYAHNQGIVHRDIKPANIMILKDYKIKVMDYGIARIDSNSMTKTGIAMGTPNYISPEQLKGLAIDRRADIFSLGVVMYEMLLGRRPFKGENITSLIYAILNHEPKKPSDCNPQIPLLFDHIIGKALKKDPRDRYQKASEITADLSDFVESFVAR